MKKLNIVKPNVRKIVDTSPKPKVVSPEQMAEALGAEELPELRFNASLPSPMLVDLHNALKSEIVSSGGRPSRREPTERKKIPLTANEWEQLGKIAEDCQHQGLSASPAQVGSILLRQELYRYARQDDLQAAASAKADLEKLQPVSDALREDMKKSSRRRGKV